METILRDIRFGVKLLLKDRAFAATAILTLAVCIGANAAIFTIVNSVLLRPLPVPESERILLMSNQYPNAGVGHSNNSGVPDYYDRLRDVKVFEEQAMFGNLGQTIEINGTPQRIRGMSATPSLFRLLRVAPEVGRAFNEDEGAPGNAQKIILSHGLWQELFAGDPNVAGREVRLSGRPFVVVGVMRPDFLFVDPEVRFWIPLAFTAQQKSDDNRHSNNFFNIGRLKPGSTLAQAQMQVDALNNANLDRFPQYKELLINAGFHTTVEPLQEMLVRDVKGTLYLLWAGAVFVLLIGGVNIANLVLARSSLRAKELVTRLALGAGRMRVARQLVTESVLLTLVGGAAGLLMGSAILGALRTIGLSEIPRASEIHMDGAAVIFTLAVSVVVGILIGLFPLGQVLGSNLSQVMREEGRSGTSGRAARLVRRTLVVAQVAFAFVLLVGAGLLLASFRALLGVDPGFQTTGVITAATNLPAARYAGENEMRAFWTQTLDAIRAIPGVTAAGATSSIPFGGGYSDSVILAEGYQMQPGESLISPHQVNVTPGYFESMSIPLVRGRLFDNHDTASSQPVVIVDESLARKFWPNQDPIGRRMRQPGNPNNLMMVDEHTRWLYVVGVVRDIRLEDLAGGKNKAGTYYFVWDQSPFRGADLTIKTSSDTSAVLRLVRAEISKIDPELPLYDIHSMDDRMATSLMSRKASMLLATSFGFVALFLSSIGIYGVLAYLVAQRTREIGIRIALGSSGAEIFRLVLREGLLLVVSGFIIGLIGTAGLRHAIENQIYGITALDPVVIGIVVASLGVVGIVACTLPARRATRVDPVSILN
jgi:predicted permease